MWSLLIELEIKLIKMRNFVARNNGLPSKQFLLNGFGIKFRNSVRSYGYRLLSGKINDAK